MYMHVHIYMHIVIVGTDLRGSELHRQVGVSIVVMSWSLHDVMIAHWPGMPEMWDLSPALGTIFPIFITPITILIHTYTYTYLHTCLPTSLHTYVHTYT